jgi:hypothetical protein
MAGFTSEVSALATPWLLTEPCAERQRTPFVGITDISWTPRYGDVIPYKDGCGGKRGFAETLRFEDLASSEVQQVHIRLNDGKHDPGALVVSGGRVQGNVNIGGHAGAGDMDVRGGHNRKYALGGKLKLR